MLYRVLVGATASGKKAVATELARRHGLQILSMDSMKVYRGMDVGTDKPNAEQRARVRWRLLDLVGHDQAFSAGRWVEAVRAAVEDSERPALFAGGTPLYLRLLLEGLFDGPGADAAVRRALDRLWDTEGEAVVRRELAAVDPVIEARLMPGDRKRLLRALEVQRLTGRPLSEWQRDETRPPLEGRFVMAGLRWPAEVHRDRSALRVERMMAAGLVAEVEGLLTLAPFAPEPGRAIGYAEARDRLEGRCDDAAMRARIVVRTRRLVRKQRGFFAAFEGLHWIDADRADDVTTLADRVEVALELPRAGCGGATTA